MPGIPAWPAGTTWRSSSRRFTTWPVQSRRSRAFAACSRRAARSSSPTRRSPMRSPRQATRSSGCSTATASCSACRTASPRPARRPGTVLPFSSRVKAHRRTPATRRPMSRSCNRRCSFPAGPGGGGRGRRPLHPFSLPTCRGRRITATVSRCPRIGRSIPARREPDHPPSSPASSRSISRGQSRVLPGRGGRRRSWRNQSRTRRSATTRISDHSGSSPSWTDPRVPLELRDRVQLHQRLDRNVRQLRCRAEPGRPRVLLVVADRHHRPADRRARVR